ncbi:glycoside hydrolase family 88 protein [Bacteroidales bacterium OttesenSCG-928-M11]|nr:glycoside hydrolase family 88 protein [Bacteroidales bacterium OttesenSCG-928-M11]
MRKLTLLLIMALLVSVYSCKDTKPTEEEIKLQEAALQYHTLVEGLAGADRLPRSYNKETDELITSGTSWWCSGFYPGTLLYLYEATKDTLLYKEAMRVLSVIEPEQYNTGTHDLGFMMYCSFGNAHRIAPNDHYKEVLVQSARSLASRFNYNVNSIRSWNSGPENFLVIIDNMMNLELLFWVAKETNDSELFNIAVAHANKTIAEHYRDDFSSFHVVNYDPESGEVKVKRTHQGYSDDSAWARGQAWGLYGFVMTYRFTNDKKYLDQAIHVADYILSHPNLPEDLIPYWDFNDPEIPNVLRDASAASIISSGLLELYSFEGNKQYLDAAERIIARLSSSDYLAEAGTNGGFLLKHSVGHLKGNSEIDVPLSYADYYYVESLIRLNKIKSGK